MIRRRTLLAGSSALAVLMLLCAPIDTRFDDSLPDALWNFGHVPGSEDVTSGCIGHV